MVYNRDGRRVGLTSGRVGLGYLESKCFATSELLLFLLVFVGLGRVDFSDRQLLSGRVGLSGLVGSGRVEKFRPEAISSL